MIASLVLCVLAQSSIEVDLGTQRIIKVPSVARIASGAGPVFDVTVVGPDQLMITGVAVGKAMLKVWLTSGDSKTFEVVVRPGKPIPPPKPREKISLRVGEKKVMSVAALERAEVLASALATVKTVAVDQIEITALAVGRTTLVLLTTFGAHRTDVALEVVAAQ